jgi:hypothetical protein
MVAAEANPSARSVLPPEQLARHAQRVQFSGEDLSWDEPIDPTKWFICPTLTPLYYTAAWHELTDAQRLRYNQLAALCSNELIGLFERTLQPIFQNLMDAPFLPAALRALLPGFVADETRHAIVWHEMNRQAEPLWYAAGPLKMVRLPAQVRLFLRLLTSHPARFPVVVWTALILEEHSLEITRRCLRCRLPMEPRFLAALRLHAQDEARHVQIDWHVLEHLLKQLRGPTRRANAWLVQRVIQRFLFKPVNAAMRVVETLAGEFEELGPRLVSMKQQLAGLSECSDYRRMIFSRESNPMSFDMGLRLAETRSFFQSLG